MKRTFLKKTNKRFLAYSIAVALSIGSTAYAADYAVDVENDNGLGDTAGTLSWAILQANTDNTGIVITDPSNNIPDTITLKTDVTITGVMKTLLNSDITLQSEEGENYTISGGNQFRPLFVKSGNVTIKNLNLANGQAKGGNSGSGGAGAGLGGALFVSGGNVLVENVNFNNNKAIGGSANGSASGGGGLFGNGVEGSGGGMFSLYDGNGIYSGNGNYGGDGNYGESVGAFGHGAGYDENGYFYINGGFGGGGYGGGGDGGFGGGGGGGGEVGGNGGFGAGGGSGTITPGEGGLGGGRGSSSNVGGGGAGMGGALFAMKGVTTLKNVTFSGNSVAGGVGGSVAGNGSALANDVFVFCQDDNMAEIIVPSCAAAVNFCGTNEGTSIVGNNIVGNLGTDCPVENRTPTAVATLEASAIVGTPISLNGSDSSDPDDDSLTYLWSITPNPEGVNATIGNPEAETTTLTPQVEGVYDVTLTVSDGNGGQASDTIQITVSNVEPKLDYPTAVDDVASVIGNRTITIDALANDSGSGLTLNPPNIWSRFGGNVALANNKVTYTPMPGFNGADNIWYTFVDDMGRNNFGKITIEVSGNGESNPFPTATADIVTLSGSGPITIDALANDIGVGLVLNTPNAWSLKGGNVNLIDNKISYKPKTGFNGEDKIWYSFKDSQGRANSAVIIITVTDNTGTLHIRPIGTPDTANTTINTPITIDVLANDTGSALTLDEAGTNVWSLKGGNVKIVDNQIIYTPKIDFDGNDKIWYVFTNSQGDSNFSVVDIKVAGIELN